MDRKVRAKRIKHLSLDRVGHSAVNKAVNIFILFSFFIRKYNKTETYTVLTRHPNKTK